jgi:ubiquinone/menaquinone biosynthesis C-methylase UbiE
MRNNAQSAGDDGILRAMGELAGNNRVAEAFYNGPKFRKFLFWENLFLFYAGGLKGSRMQILRHLPPLENGSLLEVGVGDGANINLLPRSVQVTGVDIALNRLKTCQKIHAGRPLNLVLAEAERLPFEDRAFDAALCVGGFNFFSDPALALAEMVRVVKPGGRVVVADEIPDFLQYSWGHRIHFPALDDWLMDRWFGSEFRNMIVNCQLNIDQLTASLNQAAVHNIWRGYGYCLVGSGRRGRGTRDEGSGVRGQGPGSNGVH